MSDLLELGIVFESQGLYESDIDRFHGEQLVGFRVSINGIIDIVLVQVFGLLVEQIFVDVLLWLNKYWRTRRVRS